jgi:hypothetical protein
MSNIQSYNALIDRFKAFASGHFILKRFSHGQIEVSDLEKFGEYPFMHVIPSNVTYAKGMKTFSFQIVLADLPRDKEDKSEYQREALSDLQRIAEDLIAEITNHRVLFGDLITVNNVSLEPFLEEFQHTLTGWTVSLDLLVPYYWDACSIPAEWNDFFESSTGGTGSILTFIDSIVRDENGNVSLVNDEAEPSPNYYYGTNDEGVRGWYLLSDEVGLTCVTLPTCQTIIDIEAAIDLLQQDVIDLNADVALKANTADISAVGFSNDYNDLDNKPTIPPAITNTSELVNDGEDGVNPFITAQDLPDTSGFVPYTGATTNVDLGTHTLIAKDLVINHSSGSGVAASITKGGAGEALTVNKTSGSGNAMSVTGGVTQLSELHLTTDLADAYIASAATWNAKFNLPALTSGSVLFSNGTTIAQDNANLFWDDTNNRLGIRTASPEGVMHIVDETTADPLLFYKYNDNSAFAGGFFASRARGTVASPTAVQSGDRLLSILGRAYRTSGGNAFNGYSAGIFYLAGENITSVANGSAITFETTANGTTSRTEKMRLLGNGNVGIGTATPADLLTLNASAANARIRYNNSDSVQWTAGNISSDNSFRIGSSTGFQFAIFQATGNVLLQNAGTFTDAGFKLDVVGTARIQNQFSVTGSISAASAIARGTYLNQTLVATANNDVLVGLDIAPTFTNGAFTGLRNWALRLPNGSQIGCGVSASYSFYLAQNETTINAPSGFVGVQIAAGNVARFFASTGNLLLQNGGTFTDIASARLAVNSTTQGFLPPRMTTTQKNAIASPATGLMVYDTTLNLISVYNGTMWISL